VAAEKLPLVSVITPSYNQSAYLEQTIRSVLEQEYPALEYMIVDGASSDESQEIIQRYASRLAWWVSEADTGQAEAINKGLRRAQGEIVAWLNSDDLFLPGAVSAAASVLEDNPQLGMVFGDAITIDAQGRPLNKLVFGDWTLNDLARFRIICQPAVFMRRAVLEQAGFLDPSFHFMLDHHLWMRIARLAPIQHQRQLWAAARHHPGAKNVSQPRGFSREILRLLEWIESQPDLSALLAGQTRQVQGGAYRLAARYLLDGGEPGQALVWYGRALFKRPGYTLRHAHRMFYALLCLLGLEGLLNRIRAGSAERKSLRLGAELQQAGPEGAQILPRAARQNLQNWPGLRLNPDP
jgi:glycosyltransferase involved in cell wall biosynthesis